MPRLPIPILIIAATIIYLSLLTAGESALAQPKSPRLPELTRLSEPSREPGSRGDSEYLARVGAWPYGPSHGVDVDPARQLIYLGSGGAVLVLDESDPTNPELLCDDIRTLGLVLDVFYDRHTQRLFLACGEGGLEIWDVADPLAPARLSVTEVLYYDAEVPVENVDVYSHFAIVECSWGYIHSLNVADPTHPVQVGFNGFMGNPAHDLHVSQKDGQAHTTGYHSYQRLTIQPDGQLAPSGAKENLSVAVFGTEEVGFVGYGGVLHLVDLQSGGWPVRSVVSLGGVGDVVVQGGYAYTINDDGLTITDVHDLDNPLIVSTLPVPLYPERLQVQGTRAYVVSKAAGLSIVDVSDAARPAIIGRYDVPAVPWDCLIEGRYAYLAHDDDGLMVLDIGDLQQMELVGQVDTPGQARDMVLRDDRLYLADWTGGLRVIDVSVPTAPVELGSYEAFNAWRVVIDGDIAYVVEDRTESSWLHVLDTADPAQIVELATLELGWLVWDLIQYGDYLYVGEYGSPLRILDVSNPAAPYQAGIYPLTDVIGMRERDGILFATSTAVFSAPLVILSLADPLHPAQIGEYGDFWVSAFYFDLAGDNLYLNDSDDLVLLDITDLTNPVLVDELRMPDAIFQITASDKYAFVCNASAGLQVVENLLVVTTPVADSLPARTFLAQNHPNPFNPRTEIAFGLAEATRVTLSIFDARGRLVARPLAAISLPAGRHAATWDGLDLAGRRASSGVYVYRLEAGNHVESRSMILVK